MSRIAVVGAGAVGSRVARGLIAADSDLLVDLYDEAPDVAHGVVAHLGERARVITADELTAHRPDVVVLCHARPQAVLGSRMVGARLPVVSVSDDVRDVRSLVDLDGMARRFGVPVVVGAAMSPGLSGLVARQLGSRLDSLDEIHVAVHGTGGPACARQHHRALAGTALGWHDRTWIERAAGSGRELYWFPEPLGAKDCYRADLADPILLVRAFPAVERVTARLSATRRDRLTARLPMLTPPHAEGGIGGLRVEVRGTRDGERVALVAGVAERTAIISAHVAVTFTLAVWRGEIPVGVSVPGQDHLDTHQLLTRLVAAGVNLREFVGTDARTGW